MMIKMYVVTLDTQHSYILYVQELFMRSCDMIVCDVLQRAVHLMLSQPTCLPKPLRSHQREYPVPPSWVRETERRGQTDRQTDKQTDRHRKRQNRRSYIYYFFVIVVCADT